MYGDKLDYGFKTPFFPIIPIIGITLMIGLALYLLVTAPFSWVITALWVLVGFTIYRIFTFKKEVEHYSPLLTSEGNLVKKDFKILLPYTPENPDRLVKYAIRVAKEKDAEINIIRTITVPHQTPLSAGIAFVDSSKKAFEPLEKILNNENIIYHFLVRITHDATEAILSTIAEQKINFLIIDYETIKNNKKLQTLLTCDYLAILPHRDNDILMEEQNVHSEAGLTKENRKNMVILYDDGDDSDEILKITKWFANTGNFNLNVVAINRKDNGNYEVNNVKPNSSSTNDKNYIKYIKRREYFLQAGVELNEIHVSKDIEKDNMQFAKLILKSVVTYNPDIVITESTIGKNSLLTNSSFANLLMYRINCPILIVKDFSFPLVNILSRIIKQIMGHLGPSYLVRLMRTRMK
jgi:basic amino acid/polyamine antiporter, APA family